MNLLFPLGLAALAAGLLPLLIHLARRHPYTPLEFAALRWLRARVRPRQRLRFDDWPLLLVRLLLIGALALLLARPVLPGTSGTATPWTVVAPGLDAHALQRAPGTPADSGRWQWLAPGFPSIDTPAPHPTAAATLPSLLRELDAQLPVGTPLVVHVPDPLTDLDGQRLQLSRPVQWQVHPQPAQAAPAATDTPPILRLHGEAPAPARRWLAAVQRAWTAAPLAPALAAGAVPARGEIGVWTDPLPLPAPWQRWLEQGGSVLVSAPAPAGVPVLLRDAGGAPLLRGHRVGSGRLLYLTGTWSPATPALRDPAVPQQLLRALQPAPAARRGDARDQAPAQVRSAPAAPPPARELAPWLIAAVLLLFALERWMASATRRRDRA